MEGNMISKVKEIVDEHLLKRKAMFIPIACVSTFMLVGYAAVDKEKPVIVSKNIEVPYGEEFDTAVIEVTDNRDSRDLLNVEVEQDALDMNQLGTYQVNVVATDQFSNSTTKTIEVDVVDQHGPVFEVQGANDGYYVQVPVNGSADISSYVKAIDNVDGDVTAFMEADTTLDTSKIGLQTVNLKVTDASNNISEQPFVFAISDSEAPTIELLKGADTTIDYKSTFDINEFVKVADNLDENVTINVEGSIDTAKLDDVQTLKILAKDASGNESKAELKLTVKDISGPSIQLSTNSVTIAQGATFDAKAYLLGAVDNLDGDLIANVTFSGIDTSSSGTKTVTYTVTDKAGNTTTITLEVIVDGGIGEKIAAAALAQVGVKQDCTMLVTNALRAVGIYHHGWPISYMSLGHVVPYSEAKAGDLIYYANGGTGVAHIAVYIGGGQAVHGGWRGNNTVVYGATYSNCSTPVFIRVDK